MFKSQLTAQLPLQKPTPDILVAECGNVHRWLTGTMVPPHQGVRQHTDGCMALGYSKAAMALLFQKLTTGGDSYSTYSGTLVLWGPNKGIYAIQRRNCFLLDRVLFLVSAFLSGAQFMPFCCQSSVLGMWWQWRRHTLEGARGNLTLTSAYLPYDSYELNKGLREVIHGCCRNKLHLIFGCNASEHHIRGSMDINPRGECLME